MSLLDGFGTPDFLPGMTGQTALVNAQTLFTLSNAAQTTVVLYNPSGFSTLQMQGQVAGAGTADFLTITVSVDVNGTVINVPMVRRYVVPSTGFFLRIPVWGTICQVQVLSSVNNAQLTLFAIMDMLAQYTTQDFTSGPRPLYVAAVLPVGVNITPLQMFSGRALVTAVVVAGTNIVFSIRAKSPLGAADIYVAQWTQLTIPNNHLVAEVILPPEAWYVEWDNNDAGAQTVYVTVTPQQSEVY